MPRWPIQDAIHLYVWRVGYLKRTSTSRRAHWSFSVHRLENLPVPVSRWHMSHAVNWNPNVNLGVCEIHECPSNPLCLPCRYALTDTALRRNEHSREKLLESLDNPVGVSTMIHGLHAMPRVLETAIGSSSRSNSYSSYAVQARIYVGRGEL